MTGWKIIIFEKRYIFKWLVFHCHVSFFGVIFGGRPFSVLQYHGRKNISQFQSGGGFHQANKCHYFSRGLSKIYLHDPFLNQSFGRAPRKQMAGSPENHPVEKEHHLQGSPFLGCHVGFFKGHIKIANFFEGIKPVIRGLISGGGYVRGS